MNIKLHTPKSLKLGSGMGSMKQFLLSVLATSISIALTFGTAAVLDNNKKQKEKRQIVMMVMYDMYNTIKSVEKNDSTMLQAMQLQLKIAEDTTQFNTQRFKLATLFPKVDFTEATEHIFSTSIETINTVGNVLFTENVAEFYKLRKMYKTDVCDSLYSEVARTYPLESLEKTIGLSLVLYMVLSNELLTGMQKQYAECKVIMNVTDEEIEAYRKEREQMEEHMSKEQGNTESSMEKVMELDKKIQSAKAKLNLE